MDGPGSALQGVYTEKSDAWSFGILLWEVMTLGGSPYPSVPIEKLYEILKRGDRMSCPDRCPMTIYKLMLKTWEAKPELRPTFSEIVKSLESVLEDTADQEYLDLKIPQIDTPPNSDDENEKMFDFCNRERIANCYQNQAIILNNQLNKANPSYFCDIRFLERRIQSAREEYV
jgi:serine/threonine protein kinase